MNRENAILYLQSSGFSEEQIAEIESAFTCDDAISRQAVDKLIDELARAISDEKRFVFRGRSIATIMQDILDLPSVSTEETGRWERHSYFKDAFICSACNTGGNMVYKDFKYCPNCGCRMVEPQESEE